MMNETHITWMTFYHYRIEISYLSGDSGLYGFTYRIHEGGEIVQSSNGLYKTALGAGRGALDMLERMHNEKG